MFTNKHVIIAMIVAPILSVLAWFAVGNLTGEKPRVAEAGKSYPLVEKSNCRYESGVCDLENEDFKLVLSFEDGVAGQQLVLRASHPLEGVMMSVAQPDSTAQPRAMRAADGRGQEWRTAVEARPAPDQRIRLVASAAGTSYFGDAGTLFLQPSDRPQLQR
jgi:hypothetical protein